jgi:hypothetical protein
MIMSCLASSAARRIEHQSFLFNRTSKPPVIGVPGDPLSFCGTNVRGDLATIVEYYESQPGQEPNCELESSPLLATPSLL